MCWLYYGAFAKGWVWVHCNDKWGWHYSLVSPYFCSFRGWLPWADEYEYRDLGNILDALSAFDDPDAQIFVRACRDAGIKPVVHPFWENLPYANIYQSVAPDMLHQLYQGIIKHLLTWLKSAFGEAEIDALSQWFPPNHNIHLFMNGIPSLSWLSGTKHSQTGSRHGGGSSFTKQYEPFTSDSCHPCYTWLSLPGTISCTLIYNPRSPCWLTIPLGRRR